MTRSDISRVGNIVAALTMLVVGLSLVIFVFPTQIPEGLEGDLSSGHYPRMIMIVWISASAAWLVSSLFTRQGNGDASDNDSYTQRSILIGAIIIIGFGLFATVGFITAAFVLIVSLAYVCGERGWAPWMLAAVVAPSVYVFLDTFLDVRLPTFLTP